MVIWKSTEAPLWGAMQSLGCKRILEHFFIPKAASGDNIFFVTSFRWGCT